MRKLQPGMRLAVAAARLRSVTAMQRQVLLLLVSLGGIVGGAALIGTWAIGVAIIADSVFGVWYALMRDVGPGPQPVAMAHEQVLARYRASP